MACQNGTINKRKPTIWFMLQTINENQLSQTSTETTTEQ